MTKSTETEIAVLQTQMTDVKTSLEVIKSDMHSNFTIITAKIDNLSNTPLEITAMNDRIFALEKSKAKNWIWNTLSAMAGIIFATLMIYAITKK